MRILIKSKPVIRRSTGAVLLVGVLAGVTVGGGVGVFAASSTKTVTVCADKTTNALRYSKSGKCLETETSVVLNQTGAKGSTGKTGAAGAKGKTGTAGAKGDTGAAGAKGDTGVPGTNGTNGVNATLAITQQSVCDGSDADSIANEICKVGMTGPGGGIIFFVDYDDQYTSLDYLEAAPMGWGNAINVNVGGVSDETTGSATVDPRMKWCSQNTYLGLGEWANYAVGAGRSNTSTADTTCTGGAIQAAADYAGGGKTDWFLPSLGEAMLMYTNLRQLGVGVVFNESGPQYWSSTEVSDGYHSERASTLDFREADLEYWSKSSQGQNVRPVRAF